MESFLAVTYFVVAKAFPISIYCNNFFIVVKNTFGNNIQYVATKTFVGKCSFSCSGLQGIYIEIYWNITQSSLKLVYHTCPIQPRNLSNLFINFYRNFGKRGELLRIQK